MNEVHLPDPDPHTPPVSDRPALLSDQKHFLPRVYDFLGLSVIASSVTLGLHRLSPKNPVYSHIIVTLIRLVDPKIQGKHSMGLTQETDLHIAVPGHIQPYRVKLHILSMTTPRKHRGAPSRHAPSFSTQACVPPLYLTSFPQHPKHPILCL